MKYSRHVKVSNVNHLYLIFSKVNGYFEKINKSKYLTLDLLMEAEKSYKDMKNCRVKPDT